MEKSSFELPDTFSYAKRMVRLQTNVAVLAETDRVTPKIIYFYYHRDTFTGSKYPTIKEFNFEKESCFRQLTPTATLLLLEKLVYD